MVRLFIGILLTVIVSATAYTQTYSLSGYLRDKHTGEELLYASLFVLETGEGVSTNEYGFYSISLPAGDYTFSYSYVGYQSVVLDIRLDADQNLNVELSSGETLAEVVVQAKADDQNIRGTEMSVNSLDIKDAKLIPVLFGEQDILKTIQLLPGVSPNSEGNAGFFVRGGDADQNLVLLDEAPVYNASHLLGFFSVFNSDALKDVKLYKGGIPAQYGGRLSSVLDIRMKNGNSKEWVASGGLGLISSRLSLEGPIKKDKGSVMISARRTYADLLLRALTEDFDDTALYFYDLNAKANYILGENDRIYISGYFGRDVFQLNSSVGLDWGNTTATLRWNHLYNDRLFSNTSLIYSDFDYGFAVDNAGTAIALSAAIINYNLKQDFNWYPNPNNNIQFGWNGIYHQFKAGDFVSDDAEDAQNVSIAPQQALEMGGYFDNEQRLNDRLTIQYGIRLSSFSNFGEAEVKTYNENGEVESVTQYEKGEAYNTYVRLEPRLNAAYLLNEQSSLKVSINRMSQYLHLLSNSTSGTPTDIWIPSTPLTKPELSEQIAIGYFRNIKDKTWEFSIEAFVKRFEDLVEYKDGAETFLNPEIEAELVYGQGRAYGAEFYLKKRVGPLSGWISYTLLKSERQFDEINDGAWFSARQDRTHDVSIVATYEINPRWTLSGAWVYYTGDAVTFPVGKYEIDGAVIDLFSGRNGDRMPDYHRLDLGATMQLNKRERWSSNLNFSIYNVYNRRNAFSIDFQENGNTTEAVKTSLFGIVPAVTWNFTFN